MRSAKTPKPPQKNIRERRAVELFAGAGGLGMGVSRAGFEPEIVVELDRYCCDTIRENKSAGHPLIKTWPLSEIDVRLIDFKEYEGQVDLVSGGPPCQPFSLGGKHRAFRDSRDLWSEAVRTVREARPKAFLFENVKGLTRQSFANYYEYINLQLIYPEVTRKRDEPWSDHLRRLEQHHTSRRSKSGLSYKVVRRVLNAANYGVPQRRERVFFVGFRSDLNLEWSFPEETHSFDALLWEQVITGDYWERHKVRNKDRVVSDRARARAKRLTQQRNARPWKTTRDALVGLPEPTVHASPHVLNHRLQLGARSYVGHTGSPLDEPAKTLKAGVHGVPGGENTIALPNGDVRYLTVRESARLQTFPDDFKFHGSWTETMRQLGNAVPVELAECVACSIVEQINAIEAHAHGDL
ncbi:MAG: DNA cytosine methyltransferase [Xanthobacteraceae bacterium]